MIAVTIPVHNEARFIEKTVKTLLEESTLLGEEFRVIVAEDGSTDGTNKTVQTLVNSDPRVICFHSDKKLGKGLALRTAWERVDADIYAFIDCDLATDMKHFAELIHFVKQGYDLATGSRYKKGATVKRPILRSLVSKFYNRLVRIAFKTQVYDHQAGFKAFSKRIIADLLRKCKSDHWFWDTEIIIRARQKGYRCIEFPVDWKEKKGDRTPIIRLVKDCYIFGKELLKMNVSSRF